MILITGANGHLGALDFTYDDMEKLLGRKPTGLEIFIPEFVNS